MRLPTESTSGHPMVHGAISTAAVVGVLLVLIASFMPIIATGR